MKQQLTNIPETREEAERQIEPISLTVVLLAIGLIAAFILFFGPVFISFF